MTIREKLNLIKQTQIYRLVYENDLRGFRLSMYNADTESLEYYDFIIEMINDENIMKYLQDNLNDLPVLKLINNGDYLETENERNKKIKVKEFLDDNQVNDYTKRAIEILKEVKLCTK